MKLQSYIHKINTANSKQYKSLQILFSLIFSLFIIFSAVKLTLIFKPLYYFDVQYLNIEEQSNFSKDQIVQNYDYVISYLLNPKEQVFNLPSIPYSKYGQIHFQDVKKIFTYIDILLIICGILVILVFAINIKRKDLDFLKQTSLILLILPLILLTTFSINFDASFIIFHKIFFRNGYWQFDPQFDPIINILPEEFFYHSAILILLILVISSLILRAIYKNRNKLNIIKNYTY